MNYITENIITNFIGALKCTLLNYSSTAEIKEIDHNNINANVYLNGMSIGSIVSYYEDIQLSENEYLYFLPSVNYFKICKLDSINLFLEKTSNIFKSILLSFDVENRDDELVWKTKNDVFDFNFNFKDIYRTFKINVGSNIFKFHERGRLTYKLIKKDNDFIIAEDFSFIISNGINSDCFFENFSFPELFNIAAVKNNEEFSFFDSNDECIKKIDLNIHSEKEILETVKFIIFYYLSGKVNIDIPDEFEFKNNIDNYKNLIKIALI